MNNTTRHRPVTGLSSIALLAAALLAGAPMSARAAAATPLANLVGEDAPVVLLSYDSPRQWADWQAGPMRKAWDDPQIREFFAPLRDKLDAFNQKTKERLGHDLTELFSWARGDALLAIPTLDGLAAKRPNLLCVVEYGENIGKVEALLRSDACAELLKLQKRDTERYADATLHIDEFADAAAAGAGDPGPRLVWLVDGGTLYCGTSRETVINALDAARAGGAAGAFGKSERLLRAGERLGGGAQFLMHVNLPPFYSLLDTFLKAQAASPDNKAATMVDFAGLGAILGLDALDSLFVASKYTADGVESVSGLTWSEARGLLKLFTLGDGPAPRPAFLPPDSLTTAVARFDCAAAVAALEELVRRAVPMGFAYYQNALASLKQQQGIDLKRDVLDNLGDEFCFLQRKPAAGADMPGAMEQTLIISLKDETVFRATLDKLLAVTGAEERLFQKREYLGATIHTSAQPTGSPFSWTAASGRFILGTGTGSDAVAAILQGMAGHAPSLWDDPGVARMMSDVPPDAIGLTVQDNARVISNALDLVVLIVASRETGKNAWINPDAKPDLETVQKYVGRGLSYNQRDARGFYQKTLYRHKK
jgi:hypothetical protein